MTGLAALTSLAVASPVSYLAAVAIPALDALIPLLPSETPVIALGAATAGSHDPRIAVLVALAACGAFLGDNLAYLVGRRFGPFARRRLFAGARGGQRLDWARRSLERYGARVIVACRFIPGGRTAVTLACGLVGYPRRRFLAATACAGVLWAGYAFLLRLARRAGVRGPAVGRPAARAGAVPGDHGGHRGGAARVAAACPGGRGGNRPLRAARQAGRG